MTAIHIGSLCLRSVAKGLVLTLAACVAEPAKPPPAEAEPFALTPPDQASEAHRRVNAYFHESVIPRLRDCWARLEGEGTVIIAHTYSKAKGGWRPGDLGVRSSELAAGQDRAALECMRRAVRGTTLPAGSADLAAREWELVWAWPVPLPTGEVALLRGRPGSGGGGIFGFLCDDCSWGDDLNATCVKRFVGWRGCKADLNVCTITLKRCAVGSPFAPLGVFAR